VTQLLEQFFIESLPFDFNLCPHLGLALFAFDDDPSLFKSEHF